MSQPRASTPDPTEIAGRYQVVQRLGAGAFGTVYKAKDRILGRMVAIKTIRLEGLAAQGASLDELVDRFEREAQVSAQLKHPNIVTIYDIGEADGLSYLAMEFIDGVGLERVIANAGRLPLERAAAIAAQVADALDFAHKNSVVHRDIKPANIMIEAGDRVKVTDFGIAKVINSVDHLTATGSLLGTPSYMSPEQARGSLLDGRSDLFAVGAVFYEMLTGTRAFRGESITGLIFKIITEEPTPIREVDPGLPEDVSRILARALAKAPEARYQTGREFADDLLALTRPGSLPTLRQTELATSPGGPSSAGPPTLATPPTLGGAVEATKLTPPPPRPPQARPAPVLPPQPAEAAPARAPVRKGSAGPLIAFAAVLVVFGCLAVVAGWYLFLRPAPGKTVADSAMDPRSAMTPPASIQSGPPATTIAMAPPETAPSATTPATLAARTTAPPSVRATEPPAPAPPTRRASAAPPGDEQGGGSFLDEPAAEPEADGREAGRRLSESFRSTSGSNSGSNFGASGHFQARERTPRSLLPVERPAVATLRHVIDAQEAFYRKTNHYGQLPDLAKAGTLFLDVPLQTAGFVRRGYRFEMKTTGDGFRVTAAPLTPGSRPFLGDDSGIIRPDLD